MYCGLCPAAKEQKGNARMDYREEIKQLRETLNRHGYL